MVIFENVMTAKKNNITVVVPHESEQVIDALHLMMLPAVIDPHVHFRTPGMEHKEDWRTGANAAVRGGCTYVFDMPNTLPPTITYDLLKSKKSRIDSQLREAGIPLRYQLFFGADKQNLNEIYKVKNEIIGIKVFMGCSTGNLVIDDDESLHAVFSIAAKENILVAVHAEDEQLIKGNKEILFTDVANYSMHSQIRNIEVATTAVAKAIDLAKQYKTRLYILHVSSEPEIELIKSAKKSGLSVYAETTPHHLFFDTSAYQKLSGKAVVNPPLRERKHREALLQAIHENVIDTIGSDHAPHTLEEKGKRYGECPSGMPGIEFMLPLLLNAHHQGLLSLTQIISLTSKRAKEIFKIENEDIVLVDLNKVKIIRDSETKSKCAWTPYAGMTLQGWPVYTVLRDKIFDNNKNSYR